jgi:hypothetical protein
MTFSHVRSDDAVSWIHFAGVTYDSASLSPIHAATPSCNRHIACSGGKEAHAVLKMIPKCCVERHYNREEQIAKVEMKQRSLTADGHDMKRPHGRSARCQSSKYAFDAKWGKDILTFVSTAGLRSHQTRPPSSSVVRR